MRKKAGDSALLSKVREEKCKLLIVFMTSNFKLKTSTVWVFFRNDYQSVRNEISKQLIFNTKSEPDTICLIPLIQLNLEKHSNVCMTDVYQNLCFSCIVT